ncbi:ribonuclease HI [Microbacterium marinilacus]|nr:ribonuclease HI [Microbacterium marinilacus]
MATDGACQGNPGPTGWAWIGEDGQWAAGAIPQGTNNVGELTALLRGIVDNAHVRRLTVQADSMYAINTYASWMDAHKRRGWKTSAKQPVKNVEILEALIEARDARRAAGLPDVILEHVKGHAGHRLNSWADERAVRAARHAAKGLAGSWESRAGHPAVDVASAPPRGGEDRPRR